MKNLKKACTAIDIFSISTHVSALPTSFIIFARQKIRIGISYSQNANAIFNY